ncbi:hypothetical protein [Ligilactobacillus acidipiscis]|uniref:Uncharacterized protein n=1 Tax=Ligilactobacillus acidipiscis TaxID=89059 RepID=A0A0R2KFN3_9LACO|nr:hypothetical protein [Ligilactobacillus acidipiscis]KRN88201.1 hypothetical protein IV43_GL000052 [Ligilactobacillus acidipiscis]
MDELDAIYKVRLDEGYKLYEVDHMTLDDLEHLTQIYAEKEQYIDEAFPFLF